MAAQPLAWWRRIWILGLAVFIVSAVVFVPIAGSISANQRDKFERLRAAEVELLETLLQSTIDDVEPRLRSVAAVVASSPYKPLDAFEIFGAQVGTVPGMDWFGVVQSVRNEQRSEFRNGGQQIRLGFEIVLEGNGGYVIAPERSRAFVMSHIHTDTGREGVRVGLDVTEDPVSGPLIVSAFDSGQSRASDLQDLEGSEGDGVVVVVPVTSPIDGRTVLGITSFDLSEVLASAGVTGDGLIDWSIQDDSEDVGDMPTGAAVLEVRLADQVYRLGIPSGSPVIRTVDSPTWFYTVVAWGLAILAGFSVAKLTGRITRRSEGEAAASLSAGRDQFLASVAHHIRTPLTSILGYSELLEDMHSQLSSQEVTEFAGSIAGSAVRLSSLVDNLIVVTRLDSELLTAKMDPMDVGMVVERVVGEVDSLLGRDKLVVEDTEDAPEALGDSDHVRHALRNLILNAESYGAGEVRIGFEHDAVTTSIIVMDDGNGLTDQQLLDAFEMFQDVDEFTTSPARLGVGLAVASKLVSMMGGLVEYDRRNGMTVFRIRLRRKETAVVSPVAEVVTL